MQKKKNSDLFKIVILVLILIVCVGLIIYANLLKGVIGTDETPFSLGNIIKTGLIFIIGVPVLICLKKVFNKNFKKSS